MKIVGGPILPITSAATTVITSFTTARCINAVIVQSATVPFLKLSRIEAKLDQKFP